MTDMQNRTITVLVCMLLSCLLLGSCGRKGKAQRERAFAGSFVDEFGNEFVLNDDYTATIRFAGKDSKENKTVWRDGARHDSPFATIEYNGDPVYYYLRDGKLYRHREDMEKGRCAIDIKYKE